MTSRPSWLVLGLAIGSVFLWLSLRSVNLSESLNIALQAHLPWELVAIVASIAFMCFKAWRWRVLLSPLYDFRITQLITAVYAGTAVNLVVSHVGELARVAIVSKRHRVPASALLGTIAIERLFDTASVLVFLGVLVLTTDEVAPMVVSASYVALGLVICALFAMVVVFLWTDAALRLAEKLLFFVSPRWREKILWHLREALSGLSTIRNGRLLPKVIILSVLQWTCILIGILASMRSLGLTTEAVSAIAVLVLIVVGLTLPAAPIHVGTTQLGFTFGLAAFHVTAPNAFAASIVYTVFVLLPMVILGLAALYRSGRRWRVKAPAVRTDP
ncbi:hypothetical protein HNQ60_000511 [Povalibacter uvarum]|uniref:Flippase-like domain-containing protein n=1 Tax=Povalibacter uvarum TaxID=732238 RepID=A0A841HHW9_9GAMM|nr:lysylphosphatidylglycerol synthase transmembrane domain-containing protein [Povalibacter uvarum]MBB6091665.1 hypothetical protein [Povalibacter uvarum]